MERSRSLFASFQVLCSSWWPWEKALRLLRLKGSAAPGTGAAYPFRRPSREWIFGSSGRANLLSLELGWPPIRTWCLGSGSLGAVESGASKWSGQKHGASWGIGAQYGTVSPCSLGVWAKLARACPAGLRPWSWRPQGMTQRAAWEWLSSPWLRPFRGLLLASSATNTKRTSRAFIGWQLLWQSA